jgi:hypothetical protein
MFQWLNADSKHLKPLVYHVISIQWESEFFSDSFLKMSWISIQDPLITHAMTSHFIAAHNEAK